MADATEDTTETVDDDTEAQDMLADAVEDDSTEGTDDTEQDEDAGGDSKATRGTPAKPKPAWKPPTRAEYEALQAKVSKVNAESAKRRTEIRELRQKHESDTEKASREADERAAARYKPTAIKASARSALLEARARPERLGALAGLLKVADLDIDDDGEVTGLDAEVKRVAAEYPEFFKSEEDEKPTPPRPKPGKVTASGKPAPPKEKAPWDLIADRISGSA